MLTKDNTNTRIDLFCRSKFGAPSDQTWLFTLKTFRFFLWQHWIASIFAFYERIISNHILNFTHHLSSLPKFFEIFEKISNYGLLFWILLLSTEELLSLHSVVHKEESSSFGNLLFLIAQPFYTDYRK